MKKKVVPKLRQEVKVDIVTSDNIKIYYTGKFQDFTARYIIKQTNKSIVAENTRSDADYQHFLLCPQCFIPFLKQFQHFQ